MGCKFNSILMSNIKSVKYLLPAHTVDMGGFPVKQPLPTQKIQQLDPFLLLHHAQVKPYADRPARVQGVGPHPHRGFSPFTFVVEGEVHHRDSRGNSQIAKAGEVQWMNAGAGIIHSERPSQKLVDDGGSQEIIQLWVNSPAAAKMKPPVYQYLPADQMPVVTSADSTVRSKLVVGSYEGQTSQVRAASELLILWGKAEQNGEVTYEIPEGFCANLYLIKGELKVKGFGLVDPESLVVFGESGNEIRLTVSAGSQFLVLSGRPIGEKVTQYGPYVMNTQTEVLEAMRDYQMGKMGILIED